MDLFIYYRVRRSNASTLQSRIEALQQCLRDEYGIVTGLKRRPDEKDNLQTWMEVYQSVPDGFEAALDRAVAMERLGDLIDGRRNTEYFVDLKSCV